MSKQVEVSYLEQNLGAILKMIMDDPRYELKFFEGMKKPTPTAEEMLKFFEEREKTKLQSE